VVREGRAEVLAQGAGTGGFDFECPLMSLPAVFATDVGSVPWSGAYLSADPAEAEQKRAQFPSLQAGPRIGLAWAGNPRYKDDRRRSLRLATLLPLVRGFAANWISLQKSEAAQPLDGLPGDLCVQDGASRDRDLAEAAALLSTLDLVITTDTAIAHLAGAMAKPVWILLPRHADWRWMERTEATPWYPSARLFRQSAEGDWPGLIARVLTELVSWR
jgi:hypothetical protein